MSPDNTGDGSTEEYQLAATRRRLLELGAAGAVAGLAGCSGGGNSETTTTTTTTDDGGESDTTTSGGNEPMDAVINYPSPYKPDEQNFNNYAAKRSPWGEQRAYYSRLAIYNAKEGEWEPQLASDWSNTETSFTITLADDAYWSNGDKITARDLATQWRLNKHVFNPDILDSVEIKSENEFVIHTTKPLNPGVWEEKYLPTYIRVKHSLYKDWLEKFQNASSDDERKSVKTEFRNWELQEPIGSVPFHLTTIDAQKFVFEVNKDHPVGKKLGFDKIIGRYVSQDGAAAQGYISGQFDHSRGPGGFDEDVGKEKYPDHFQEYKFPRSAGPGVYFNYSNNQFGGGPELSGDKNNVKVRQAIMDVVDTKEVLKIADPDRLETWDEYNTGLGANAERKYLGDAVENFRSNRANHERAKRLLQDAGYTKDGEWWTRDGKALSASITTNNFDFRVNSSQVMASQLKQFGIKSSVKVFEPATFFSKVHKKADYELFQGWHGHPAEFPWFDYNPTFAFRTASGQYPGKPSAGFKDWGRDTKVTVPPVGEIEGEPTETHDIPSLLNELQSTQDEARTTEITQIFAWILNWHLPGFKWHDASATGLISTDHWNVATEERRNAILAHPFFWAFQSGEFTAKMK